MLTHVNLSFLLKELKGSRWNGNSLTSSRKYSISIIRIQMKRRATSLEIQRLLGGSHRAGLQKHKAQVNRNVVFVFPINIKQICS